MELDGSPDDHDAAVESVAREALRATAGVGGTITYAELAVALTDAGHAVSPDDPALGRLLGRLSVAEDAAGRGMLSAVVVRRRGGRPGAGFFRLAESLGRDTSDRERCWREELARVHAAHRR